VKHALYDDYGAETHQRLRRRRLVAYGPRTAVTLTRHLTLAGRSKETFVHAMRRPGAREQRGHKGMARSKHRSGARWHQATSTRHLSGDIRAALVCSEYPPQKLPLPTPGTGTGSARAKRGPLFGYGSGVLNEPPECEIAILQISNR
jgi:hypothetical protein